MRLRGVIIVESLLADIGWLQGPYVAYVEKMTSCENGSTDGSWSMNSHVSHFNRYKPYEKQILSGNFTLNSSLDDTVWVNLRMDIRANNQWKPNAFVLKIQNACSTFRSNFRGVFNVVFKGVPQDNPCSVPTGIYTFNDPVDWNFSSVPVFPYGFYLVTCNVGKKDSKISNLCLQGEMRFIPKSVT